MSNSLLPSDRQKIRQLAETLEMNNKAASLLSVYLNSCPDFITREMVDAIRGEFDMPEEEVFLLLLMAACGLDADQRIHDRQLVNLYLRPAIRKLDPETYRKNSYYQNIRIPEVRFGRCRLTYEKYKPYEAFVWQEHLLEDDFKEIPQIGFFDTEFSFPAVMENEVEWMAIKPNEIETMQAAVTAASGQVITFGLGMGYYAYMVSEKPEVTGVTIVERNKDVISLFTTHLLPQFPHRNKINIIEADTFDYVTHQMPTGQFNYAFVDLWHDVSDGYPLYRQMKALESLHPATTFAYWIEDSLLSNIRWRLFHQLMDTFEKE